MDALWILCLTSSMFCWLYDTFLSFPLVATTFASMVGIWAALRACAGDRVRQLRGGLPLAPLESREVYWVLARTGRGGL